MNRRTFLSMLGLAPLLPVAARLPEPKPAPLEWESFVGYTFIRKQLLEENGLGGGTPASPTIPNATVARK